MININLRMCIKNVKREYLRKENVTRENLDVLSMFIDDIYLKIEGDLNVE